MKYDLSNPLDLENAKLSFDRYCKNGEIIDLTKNQVKRSLPQNSYLHVCIAYFASQYGCKKEYAKREYFKILCNPDIFIKDVHDKFLGDIKIVRSSADLTKEEMTTAIERFRNWSAAEASIYIPSPTEGRLLKLAEIEIERNKNFI
jgi:hypothetical protein